MSIRLRALPAWFGIEEGTGDAVGFLPLNYHTAYAAEIYVMKFWPMYRQVARPAYMAAFYERMTAEVKGEL